ncbi:hypothetical protein QTJ16_003525 [Diplocarpon rosae]|uniref:Gag1-like clamp domain-containing protein n=1 Tax=Diplocarpon rosae TaxID=946125 RepID=A0AAD9WFY7_9HELO|nr:hypothetical protein QTJ16_003525 [Diplocarpon rosae]
MSTATHDHQQGEEATAASTDLDLDPDPPQTSGQAPITASLSQQDSHASTVESGNPVQNGTTISMLGNAACFSTTVPGGVSAQNHDSAPPYTITAQSPRDMLHTQALPTSTATTNSYCESRSTSASSSEPVSINTKQEITATDGAADVKKDLKDKMKFGSNIAGASSLQRRRNYANTSSLTDYEADLTNLDRAKQKEAVKKYLTERVKNDWKWEWPTPEHPIGKAADLHTEPPELESTAQNTEDNEEGLEGTYEGNWKERDEWLSNGSDEEDDMKVPLPRATASSHDTPTPTSKKSSSTAFKFGSPDQAGATVRSTESERKRRRKKRLADELVWNDGMRCFVARRDNWTGARKVRRSLSEFSPAKTPVRASISSEDGGSSTAIEQEEDDEFWQDDMEVPIAPPILPPENAMRASILPGAYNTIYDKVVVQGLSPSCPMNLKDVTRSCVQGWKRDGEWPPRSSVPDTHKKKGRKMSVASLLGFNDKEKEKTSPEILIKDGVKEPETKRGGTGIRSSFSKILHIGKRS